MWQGKCPAVLSRGVRLPAECAVARHACRYRSDKMAGGEKAGRQAETAMPAVVRVQRESACACKSRAPLVWRNLLSRVFARQ